MAWIMPGQAKLALRGLMKDRGFTTAAILTLAVCLGANSAIFTIVHSVLLKPLPFAGGDRILLMSNRYPKAAAGDMNFSSGGDYYDRLKTISAFEQQAAFNFGNQTVEINGSPEQISGMSGTPSLFRLLGTPPALGRWFSDDEGEIGNQYRVILSHGLWLQLHGGDRSVIGRSVRISGRDHTITGVMPRDFLFINPEVRVWTPLAFTLEQKNGRHSNNWYNIGLLKAGATVSQAQAQVDALNAANLERFPQWRELLINAGFHTKVQPLRDMLVEPVRNSLLLLWGGAGFVLLIGAVNVANLSFARMMVRSRETATRLALGAGRLQLGTQIMIESLLITLGGAIAGTLLSIGLMRLAAHWGLQHVPRAAEITLDATSIGYILMVSLVAGLILGLIPIARVFRSDLSAALRQDSRTGTAGRQARVFRQGLVVAQIALAFVLVTGAGLLLASFRQLLAVDPGFQTERIVTASVRYPRVRYRNDDLLRSVTTRSLEAFRRIPGVTAAGLTSAIPFGGDYSDSVILAEGYQMKPGESLISPKQITVSPGYMEAMRIPLLRGRYFRDSDDEKAPRVIVIDERLANKFWPGSDPVGKRMYLPSDINSIGKTDEKTEWLTIAGVVRAVRLEDLAGTPNAVGAYYFPYAQNPGGGGTFVVETSANAASVGRALRAEMARIDPELALFEIRTMTERAELSLASRKAAMALALGFGAIALFLAGIGVFGVLAFLVTQRTREIGIRLALGCGQARMFRLLLREGLALTAIGLGLGAMGSTFLGSVVEKQIYGVRPFDPLVVGSAVCLLAAIAIAASIIPARRAAQVDPLRVLADS